MGPGFFLDVTLVDLQIGESIAMRYHLDTALIWGGTAVVVLVLLFALWKVA